MTYVDKKQKIWVDDEINIWESKKFKIYWQGCLFIPNIPVGEKSIGIFIKEIESQGIEQACSMLYGNFYCLVFDKEFNIYYAFTDNSRQSFLFYDSKNPFISSSFLHLVKLDYLKIEDMLSDSVVEFILTGFIFSSKIFFENIKIIEADEIIIFPEDKNQIITTRKKLGNIFFALEKPTKPKVFLEKFQKIANSLKGYKISIDLTGGTDTRVLMEIFCSLGLDFETAISGQLDCSDVLISRKIAQKKDLTHFITQHIVNPETLESELEKAFYLGDGLTNVLDSHRLCQFQEDKKKRGIDFSIGGSGGELYKDGGWFRAAFIKRNKKRIIDSLVNSGLVGWGLAKGKILGSLFSEKFSKLAINYKRNLSQKLYTRFTGSPRQNFYKMADQIFYEYSVRAPRGFNQRLITTYAPLLEKNIVKLGINVPEKERLFHIFYRKIVTSLDPRMAKIRTNRGDFTMHSGTYYITTDILKMFLMNTLKKFFKKKKIEVTNPEIYSVVRNFTQTKNLLELLKSYKIINKNVELKNIDNRYLGRLVSLGKLIKYIGENSKIQLGK